MPLSEAGLVPDQDAAMREARCGVDAVPDISILSVRSTEVGIQCEREVTKPHRKSLKRNFGRPKLRRRDQKRYR
jgi:hypothetical protein